MKFEVYCDENYPDLFNSSKPQAEFMMIGSLWLPESLRTEIKQQVLQLRQRHNIWGEIKWRKVDRRSLSFYQALIDLFVGHKDSLRFRCIAVSRHQFNNNWHDGDNELGFYKFYYQLLHHWILDFNEYRIFCDIKQNRDLKRLETLKRCLDNSNISANIAQIQSLPSSEVVLIQLCDLLLGMASARMNRTLRPDSAKEKLVLSLEGWLGRQIGMTHRDEKKFNVFRINLQGGW
ncbi:Protein of unknown function [Pasteurella testudinis DSM 23072]|uniref:DUF3800 domain-containing protein n=1 Tax=Pasteurella testudinis DSM 23072 TaxID=1122938 RepID=A0A1W1V756_9PAST|nr:DUF3800 domain-containing protein [Pasteurella testudinis]SMB89020.1 Protein of unknown function [Pasteurella testudinis DSM 23072]SUB50223.1 Protein of uncharacterised function (DUF3800) [Pasteurella testudinis]